MIWRHFPWTLRDHQHTLTFVLLCLYAVYRHGASWYLGGVSAMALLVALGNYLRTYLTVLAGVRASKQLHLDVRPITYIAQG